MKRAAVSLVSLLLLLASSAPAQEVRLDSGPIQGTKSGDVSIFRGIPYAAPPTGGLRWKPPQPARPWKQVRDCTRFGPACPQPSNLFGFGAGKQSEDCLDCNVWTTTLDAKAKRPVMVWIHGGGNVIGSGSQPFYDGSAFARRGVVLVTFNYRLGIFGFFAHPLLSAESPHKSSGNYGLLDQIAMLRWVRRNIAAFGGDPDCVTIFGESAGAVDVARLMVSPLSEGLFERAIAESGGALGGNRNLRKAWYGTESAEAMGERISAALGCRGKPHELEALRAKSAEDLLAASKPRVGIFGKGNYFGPVVDGWVLPDDPQRLFDEGKQHDVPFLTGTNQNEGVLFLAGLRTESAAAYRQQVKLEFGARAGDVLALFPVGSREDVAGTLDDLVTVAAFTMPARAMALAMERKRSPGYVYRFHLAGGRPSVHGSEIPFVFGTSKRSQGLLGRFLAGKPAGLSDEMGTAWVRFAKTGDPNGKGLPRWRPYTRKDRAVMIFGDPVRTQVGLDEKKCDLLEACARDNLPQR